MLDGTKEVFLTGATGLIGSYLLKQQLENGASVTVLVRNTRFLSGTERIRRLITNWNRQNHTTLPMPHVIEGHLANPQCDQWRAWHQKRPFSFIHCAASLAFDVTPQGEPWHTNCDGTRNILNVCQDGDVRDFHEFSTAYIAGNSRFFTEKDFDCGQKFHNVYEESKFDAEKMFREARLPSLTIYRPSIVVGHTQTGDIRNCFGFYAVLKLMYLLAKRNQFVPQSGIKLLKFLGMSGVEHKNFVPINWVTHIFSRIFNDSTMHGKTYHLVNPHATSITEYVEAMLDAIQQCTPNIRRPSDEHLFCQEYAAKIKPYTPYFQNDTLFDSQQVQRNFPQTPCPQITKELMIFLSKQAIRNHFGKI